MLNLTPQSVSANVLSLVTACYGTKHVLVLPLRLQQVAEPLWHFLVSKTELMKPAGWQMLSKKYQQTCANDLASSTLDIAKVIRKF